ncbi:unnamed protein product [Eruca vesicaria subsp. sativa]|uniref:Bifunctional inhibitor/plant lipid transfer protein/seed storage helical domain-containing protein n=1 Tax=Eruca vesicaria subsp. sativa TaxID=29727 RepID=A0ABC8K1D8_ERUVS|nr:unnamed protein product [Eruca vesicaria subsp. sativa]
MASKTIAIVLLFNIIFFTMVNAQCPPDQLVVNVCASLLNGVVDVSLPAGSSPCCPLLSGIVDANAAACLCSAVRANVGNFVNLNIPVAVSFTLNHCELPTDFQCI